MKQQFEKRMYFLTMRNISEIQKGIQSGHAQMEYALKYWKDKEFQDWANYWKTWIVLSGGTSNDGREENEYHSQWSTGSMENYLDELNNQKIKCAEFYEPDLNWSLSAIAFIVDERVFNKEDYPDFSMYCNDKLSLLRYCEVFKNGPINLDTLLSENVDISELYSKWLTKIGGQKNAFLKSFLSQFKLA